MGRDDLLQAFPRLAEKGFEITSPIDPKYNCIAYAAGDMGNWWWPQPGFPGKSLGGYYWPTGLSVPVTLASFEQAYATLGYARCESGSLEFGTEKIAIYSDGGGLPTHAARQLIDGTWVSKLGGGFDIVHNDVEGVCGSLYGQLAFFMGRPL
ncbi:hypothetical protein QEZ54_35460 [Catellatospora sp. KI3]|uniref:DUF7689 domain-containing protein n=1 Tax=Catellatospora sp. KI3 TaxID=3041620 RepID=UPI002482C2B4|nr:hypothetical protein [Catellatospora sp. KI3]MDI1466289.1 hypothetical protein [Catellatospora sp. KI3]